MSRSIVSRLAPLFALGVLAATGCHSTQPVQAKVGIPVMVAKLPSAPVETQPKKLTARELDGLKSQLLAARKKHLDMLHAYWQAGVFPKNLDKPVVANIFRDGMGHLCAVANMVDKDGLHEVVDETARTNNFVRVASLDSGPLYDWSLTSGFTREEIAMIQVPYMPPPVVKVVGPTKEEQIARAESQERTRLMNHLQEVEKRLRDDTDQSVEIAMNRLAGDRTG